MDKLYLLFVSILTLSLFILFFLYRNGDFKLSNNVNIKAIQLGLLTCLITLWICFHLDLFLF